MYTFSHTMPSTAVQTLRQVRNYLDGRFHAVQEDWELAGSPEQIDNPLFIQMNYIFLAWDIVNVAHNRAQQIAGGPPLTRRPRRHALAEWILFQLHRDPMCIHILHEDPAAINLWETARITLRR